MKNSLVSFLVLLLLIACNSKDRVDFEKFDSAHTDVTDAHTPPVYRTIRPTRYIDYVNSLDPTNLSVIKHALDSLKLVAKNSDSLVICIDAFGQFHKSVRDTLLILHYRFGKELPEIGLSRSGIEFVGCDGTTRYIEQKNYVLNALGSEVSKDVREYCEIRNEEIGLWYSPCEVWPVYDLKISTSKALRLEKFLLNNPNHLKSEQLLRWYNNYVDYISYHQVHARLEGRRSFDDKLLFEVEDVTNLKKFLAETRIEETKTRIIHLLDKYTEYGEISYELYLDLES